jgi:ABC-type molybdate transport system substrate-binding protein
LLKQILMFSVAAALFFPQTLARAQNGEIVCLCPVAMQAAIQETLPSFHQLSGRGVKASYANVGVLANRLRAGEPADLIIVSPQLWESLKKDALVKPDVRVVVEQ